MYGNVYILQAVLSIFIPSPFLTTNPKTEGVDQDADVCHGVFVPLAICNNNVNNNSNNGRLWINVGCIVV